VKEWMRVHRRSAVICGLTLLLPLYILLRLFAGLWDMYGAYQSDVDYLIPRIARLDGLLQQEERLRESHARAVAEINTLVYPATENRATVTANLQTAVRGILSGAGLSVSNSQVLPRVDQGGFDYLGLRLTVRGRLEELDAALRTLGEYQPLVLVTSVDIKPGRVSRSRPGEQTLSATLQVLSLRVQQ